MDKGDLENLLKGGLSQREVGKALGKSQGSVQYWLAKYGLETVKARKTDPLCVVCGENKRINFYGHKKSRCGTCHNRYTKELAAKKRKRAVNSAGGKCTNCGYNDYSCALDFHHLDPGIKDPKFNNFPGWSWSRIEKELKKCILLCKNCHAVEHFLHK